MGYSLEKIYRLYDDEKGVCIEIRPDQDSLGMLEIHTPDEASKKWFGEISFNLTHEIAEQLGMALISASRDKGK